MGLKSISKYNLKNSFGGVTIIVLVSASAMFFTNGLIAYDLSTITRVATNTKATLTTTKEIPTGYVKGDYKTKATPYYPNKAIVSPLANELSLQEAAEIAAQDIFKFYGVNLTNQTLEMCYLPKDDDMVALWNIDVKVTPDYFINLGIDASTGVLLNAMFQGGPGITRLSASEDKKIVDAGMAIADKGLPNLDEAYAKVKELLIEKGFITEPITSIEYFDSIYGTDYAVAHPYSYITHAFDVTTVSNKTYFVEATYDLSNISTVGSTN